MLRLPPERTRLNLLSQSSGIYSLDGHCHWRPAMRLRDRTALALRFFVLVNCILLSYTPGAVERVHAVGRTISIPHAELSPMSDMEDVLVEYPTVHDYISLPLHEIVVFGLAKRPIYCRRVESWLTNSLLASRHKWIRLVRIQVGNLYPDEWPYHRIVEICGFRAWDEVNHCSRDNVASRSLTQVNNTQVLRKRLAHTWSESPSSTHDQPSSGVFLRNYARSVYAVDHAPPLQKINYSYRCAQADRCDGSNRFWPSEIVLHFHSGRFLLVVRLLAGGMIFWFCAYGLVCYRDRLILGFTFLVLVLVSATHFVLTAGEVFDLLRKLTL
jgi:hypothetical protein